jgi:hypothetical protein
MRGNVCCEDHAPRRDMTDEMFDLARLATPTAA